TVAHTPPLHDALPISRLAETVRKQRHAAMDSDCAGFRRRVPKPCEYSNSVKRPATFQFFGNRGWIIPNVEVLRNVLDRTPGSWRSEEHTSELQSPDHI